MIKVLRNFLPIVLLSILLISGCNDSSYFPTQEHGTDPYSDKGGQSNSIQALAVEGFEAGTKTAYAAADVTLGTGVWNLNDALIGTTTSDVKNGTKSARIRYSGKITMKFNTTSGASTVTIKHAKYGTDASSTWQLWYSVNSGSTWTQTGSTITTSATTLQTATFTVNISGTIRFEIRKTDGTANRINIDDIAITDYSTTPPPSGNVNLTMGNPSGATVNVNYPTNYLLDKPQFCASYNRDKGIPNWVSWQLNATWCNGPAVRKDNFIVDNTLPSTWYHVTTSNYTGTGFSRGHMCPSADRLNTQANNDAVFVMTNIIPQNQTNNASVWEGLETYERTLANSGNVVYIICGGYGAGGTGLNGYATTIAGGKVTVPAKIWKVMLVLPNGTNDVSRVTTTTRTIAIITNNNNGPFNNWGTYRTSVDYIESITGYDFFSNVPASIQAVIESKVDAGPTQ